MQSTKSETRFTSRSRVVVAALGCAIGGVALGCQAAVDTETSAQGLCPDAAPHCLFLPFVAGGSSCNPDSCGADAHCAPGSHACVCDVGFVGDGQTCAATDPGEPASRSAAEVCSAWESGRIEHADPAWVAGANECDAGAVSIHTYRDTLRRINLYRWLSGLPPIGEDDGQRNGNQACAVMMLANRALDHSPPPDWTCYSDEGARGAGRSNLAGTLSSPANAIDAYMLDWTVASLGHRRWLMNGPLGRVGVGYAGDMDLDPRGGFSCLGVFDNSQASYRQWTAYPNPGPSPLANALGVWSMHANGFDLDGAAVQIVDEAGVELAIDLWYPARGYGPNAVAMQPSGWTPSAGHRYQVTVTPPGHPAITYGVTPVDCGGAEVETWFLDGEITLSDPNELLRD